MKRVLIILSVEGFFLDRITGGLFAAPVFMAAMGIGIIILGLSALLARVKPLSALKI